MTLPSVGEKPRPYVPPHLRNKGGATAAKDNSSSVPKSIPATSSRGGGDWSSDRGIDSRSGAANRWCDSYDRFGSRPTSDSAADNTRFARPSYDSRRSGASLQRSNFLMEKELFGDPTVMHSQTEESGINFDSYDNIPVEMTGDNVPPPVQLFSDLPLEDCLTRNVKLAKYERPTPVQKHAIPVSLAHRDLMACAQTGSGKTAAFLVPTVQCVLNALKQEPPTSHHPHHHSGTNGRSYSSRRSKACPRALILSPTRELTTQIHKEARRFCYCTGLRPVVVYGGQEVRLQLRELEEGCDILVATPGRLVDLVGRGRVSLANISILVFDEADRMLDMGFEPQIRRIVEEEGMPMAGVRQTLMFSATFPHRIQQLAGDFMTNYVFLAVGRVGSTNEFIKQQFERADDVDKRSILMRLLPDCEGLTLIFVETKRSADGLEDWLNKNDINATSIHGDRSQSEREYALKDFKSGRCPVLVATDVASRGLDIPNVKVVIQFDLPNNIDDYVHRIGRTGRCGNVGTAIAMVESGACSYIGDLIELILEAKQEVPSWMRGMAYSHRSSGGGARRNGGGSSGGGAGGKRSGGASRYSARDMRQDSGYQTAGGGNGGGSNAGWIRNTSGSSGSSGFNSRSSSRNDAW